MIKEDRKPGYPVKVPDDELQKLPPAEAENSSPSEDSKPHLNTGGRPGNKTC